MKLCEIFEPENDRSIKQDELRSKTRKWRLKSKKGNPTHEFAEVKGRTTRPEYTAMGGEDRGNAGGHVPTTDF